MEEVKKRKRGRPRKIKLPDEVQSVIDIVKETETKEAIQEPIIKKKEGEWDIPIGAPIAYFDKNLSYEVTGYKPIDATHGLDFNPSWFTEARDNFLRTGHYCQFQPGSKLYRDFWQQEYVRCRTGMTVNGYTLTGNNYFFLNYYQLPDTNTERAGTSRAPVFPSFLVYQYEFFHYFELCKICRKNVNLMKSRGIGFSEINASISANQYSCFRNSMCIITASNQNYTEKTLEKVWNALTFLNNKTDGGFFKLRQALDTAFKKRASFFKIVNGQKVEDGWMSQIEGIVADDDSKIRGDRADLLIFEEAGHNKNLRKSFIKGEALVSVGGNKFGIIMAGGR